MPHPRSPSTGRHRLRWLLAFQWLAGCAGVSTDSGQGAGDGGTTSACGSPGATYAAGLEMPCDDGDCSVILLSAEPSPPDKGDNVWTVRVEDATGRAISGLDSVEFEPFMPEHGHPSSPDSFPASVDSTGLEWTSEPMAWFMAGLWEVTVVATPPDGEALSAVFTFCAEG